MCRRDLSDLPPLAVPILQNEVIPPPLQINHQQPPPGNEIGIANGGDAENHLQNNENRNIVLRDLNVIMIDGEPIELPAEEVAAEAPAGFHPIPAAEV
jgi:hypothetical protein